MKYALKPTKPPAKPKPATKPKALRRGKRPASLYAQTGEDARRKAQRELLLRTLRRHGWRFPPTAEALGLSGSAGVVRALLDVAPDEYAAAKADGRIKQGAPRA